MIAASQDLVTGLLFTAVGLFFFIAGLDLTYGSPANMGPGFLPLTISAILIVLGIVQIVRGYITSGTALKFNLIQPAIISAAIVAFAFMLPSVGAVVAVLCLMLVPAVLHKQFAWKTFGLSYLFVISLVLIFKFVLGSSIPLWNL